MGSRLYQEMSEAAREREDAGILWVNVFARVAVNDDDEHRHRIKCIIPILNETKTHDEWIEQLGGFAGAGGYGNFDIPKIGQEVRLFGELGKSERLSYLCTYNEENDVPGDFPDETVRGVRSDCDYKIIVEGDLQIRAGSLKIEVDSTVEVIAPAGYFERTSK